MIKIAIASDHAGFEIKLHVINTMSNEGYEFADLGSNSKEPVDYADYAFKLAEKVSSVKN